MAAKKVVLAGIGKRSRKVLLPALWEQEERYTVKAILGTKTREETVVDMPARTVSVVTELTDKEWKDVDLLVVAVPKEAVGAVVTQVPAEFRKNITLLLDTPVISPKHLGLLRIFKQFKNTFVSEDSIGMPFLEEATALIRSRAIGTLKHITFSHSGYRYHAVAAARRLTGAHALWIQRCVRTPSGGKRYLFMKGVTVEIREPRNYLIGKTLITGRKGRISSYQIPPQKSTQSYVIPDAHTDEEIETAKRIGFQRILQGVFEEGSTYRYAALEGVYDYCACAISERFGIFLDLPIGRTSLVKILIGLLSLVLP